MNAFTKDDLLLLIKWQNAIIEQMKNCLNCKFGDLGEDDIWCYNKERYGFYDAKKRL